MIHIGDFRASATLSANVNTGKVQVIKKDAETSEFIEGVEFQLLKSDGTQIGTAKTNSQGIATFTGLYPGSYKLREISTDDEYILNSEVFDITVEYNETTTKTVTNYHKKGHLKINKTDVDTSEPISGVRFQLIDSDGNVAANGTTDVNGELYFENLRTGKYTLKETGTAPNYVLNTAVFDVDIEYEKTTVKDITNEYKKGHIKINKTDAETSKGIEGVTFALIDEKGKTVATAITDKDGVANFKNIRIGSYKLKEIDTNPKYILNTAIFEVEVEYQKTTVKDITNEHKRGDLKVFKVDKDNNRVALGNVIFDLFSYEFNKVVGTYTTNVDGEITIKDLRIGDYKLIERNTGKWYNLADDTEVEVNWNVATDAIVENELKKGQVKVIKVDMDNNEVRIPGVKFEVLDVNNKVLETITTDTNGEALTNRYAVRDFENLKLHEIETDKWYVLNDEPKTVELQANEITSITFENEKKKGQIRVIKVDMDNNEIRLKGVTFDVLDESSNVVDTIKTDENGEAVTKRLPIDQQYTVVEKETLENYTLTEETQTVTLEQDQITDVTFQNEVKKGQVKVIKVDKYNNEIRLEGIKFNVLDEDGNIVDTLTTDSNGEAVSKRLRIDTKYTLQEVETLEIYDLTEETQTVELQENEITSVTFENELKKAKINVIKVDKDNNEIRLEGIKFNILDNDGNIVDTITTNSNGEAISKELTVDKTYTICEIETLDNYVLNDEPITVTLLPGEIKDIIFENELKKGQIQVIKVDTDDNEVRLAGVEFNILDEDNNIVGTLITDENVEAVSDRLRIDKKYRLQETKTLQEYVLSEDMKTIELKENEITSITFENEKIKGYVEITKVDKNDNTKLLENATFGIYDENDNLVQTITTDKDGKAISDKLTYGKYYLKELDTGSVYYLLNENTFEFEIVNNDEIIQKTIDNEPTDITVDVDKEGTTEIKPGENVDYVFSNVANNSNVYLENFKWYDYIPTDYVRLQTMTTGTWNQDLTYSVYYKTNKSEEYILFKDNLSTKENYDLDFTTLELAEDEYITETCFDFGKVETGFRETTSPTMQCKSLETLENGQVFTNHTKTVGIYFGITAEADSKWTTIVHIPEVPKEPVLPKTGR